MVKIKRYVRDYVKKNKDGDKLQIVKVYESKPHRIDYVVFLEK